ncbi:MULTISPECIES: OprD family porin [Pseudomonas]|uniref:Outer membrane low permeability porin OccD1/OprD n=1 Tax=Pseudomonas chlororaphis subsp. aureofaciens TaxID=587851 RepID=A0AAD0ZGT0_9PSED|nr:MULTISPECIES: OprD family porin [Pseudomonas]AIC21920.1 porin [Pseudomonas chlororaphis]AZD56601.1 Outer membrane low permeability porin OccD1/OprD [Pseudomonas chlororaphis subsp. aurantiaca]AZD62591.1 Outer membrane low permeability porin OccD1/OprD [Pseudomonas chlororaphis subsp. aurantiaca]AZD94459.1 Outer membrane low permeability porin OccD1/OprD [Pseudomonas chlororaphis subsp. aureofaciens]AZE00763.1 Outer membrane low permeability porin OccD1/OprD [Pseudomonas chlororaphis subsp. 
MRVMKWSMIALAVAAAGTQVAMAEPFVGNQADAKGFVEDSKLDLLLRNYYYNRNKTGYHNRDDKDWTQGFHGVFKSGYTQGTVGVGVDAFGYLGIKLDGEDRYSGSGNLSTDSEGHNHDSFGKAGAAAKFRISKTELKIGDMQPSTSPVFAVGGSRLLPQTASGIQLQSSELEGLDLEAGHFYSASSQDEMNRDGELHANYASSDALAVTSNSMDYIGGKYAITPELSASLYGGKLEDVWNQYYANLNYTIPLGGDQSINLDGNIYRTTDTGKAKAGDISNTTYSLAAAYSFLKAHTLTLGFQKVNGDTPFDYIGVGDNNRGGDSIFLANSIQYSDFNGPGEKSVQARYDLKMAEYGVPGLSFMARYVKGWDIDGTKMDIDSPYRNYGYGEDGKHHETNLEAKYVIQTGPAKDLSFRARQAWHTANADQAEGDISEFRLIVDYPLSIL